MKSSVMVIFFAALLTFAFGTETGTFSLGVSTAIAKSDEESKSDSKDKEDSKSSSKSDEDSKSSGSKSSEDSKSSSSKSDEDSKSKGKDKVIICHVTSKSDSAASKSSDDSKSSSKSSDDSKSSGKSSDDSKSSGKSSDDSKSSSKSDEGSSSGASSGCFSSAKTLTLSVASSAVPAHLDHGDSLGACDGVTPSCVCPPGVCSCVCADGTPGAANEAAGQSSSSSTHREIMGQ
ncbi:MAG: hypothetical protein CO187_03320 [Zetaproteobacteria bacterium CG_4_9_14_3_um_filter_53_7]|nr:MAG: hypothetical protein CO187_03320 [Zetaproteobacteria bacterium CG_4_9_14_3_um_filter_53_7]